MPFIIVLGAGVIGLSTALTLQEKGHEVLIVADILPEDPKSIRYASHWAGAHHVSAAGDDARRQRADKETFDKLWAMSEPGQDSEECIMRLLQVEFHQPAWPGAHCLEFMPEFRYVDKSELIPKAEQGLSFNSVTVDMPVYLPYLSSKFRAQGGHFLRASIDHLAQLAGGAYSDGRVPGAIVVCTGIGARFLGGVEDKDVYPIRGVTVLLKAPWVKFGRTFSDSRTDLWTYVIPRKSGNVIVGGLLGHNDWEPNARPEEVDDILKRVIELAPELSPKYVEDKTKTYVPSADDLRDIIISTNCGLRPGRNGGFRLEAGQVSTAKGLTVPVVHNYGHGGYGVIASWGSASSAAELVEEALALTKGSNST